MTDYPLLTLGSYETYQLAHIATYIAERIGRHHAAPSGRHGREQRVKAVRDLAGAATALGNASGADIADHNLPRSLDRDTYTAARELLTSGPRQADVVALAGMGRAGFAVLGHVPGLGAVGAHAPTAQIADALRNHLLTRPVDELGAWAVTAKAQPVPALPQRVDLAAFVEHLDPTGPNDRAVARNLRGQDRRTDTAIRGRFVGVDLDAAPVVAPVPGGQPLGSTQRASRTGSAPAPAPAVPGVSARGGPVQRQRRHLASRSEARLRLRYPGPAANNAPSTNAGP